MMSFLRRSFSLATLLLVVLSLSGGGAIHAQTLTEATGIYYIGPEDILAAAIDLAAPYVVRVDQPDLAQVIVINNAPIKETLRIFGPEIQRGRLGLVLFTGPLFPQGIDDLRVLLGFSTFGMATTSASADVESLTTDDPLVSAIPWRTAPPIHARTVLTNPNLLEPLIATQVGEGLIQRVRGREATQVYLVGGWMGHPSNEDWNEWPYFNYLIYRLIIQAAGDLTPLSFADYPPAPTPERDIRWGIAGVGLAVMLFILGLYHTARRRLFLNPPESVLRLGAPKEPKWHDVGFHRPLAGFLALMPISLLLIIPVLYFEGRIVPQRLIPNPHAFAYWTHVRYWLAIVWLLVDAGTGVAGVRYFSLLHRRTPNMATQFLQFYTWWQFLSSAAQLGLICLMVAGGLPAIGMAHLSYILLARALLHFPGFFGVLRLALRARQRFDFEQFLGVWHIVVSLACQMGAALTIQRWHPQAPEVGAGVANVLGLAVGLYVGEIATFLMAMLLHRRDGQHLRTILIPAFDPQVTRSALSFGVPWALASALPLLGAVIQSHTIASIDGSLSSPLLFLVLAPLYLGGYRILLDSLYTDLLPSLCEAKALGYTTLLRYYLSQGIKYGVWFSLFILVAFTTVGHRLVATLDIPALPVQWLPMLLIWGALRWAVWLPDRMLEAAGRPGALLAVNLVEQAMATGGILLLGRFGVGQSDIPWIYGLALTLRLITTWVLASRSLVRPAITVWQTLVAPGLASLALLALFAAAQGWEATEVLLNSPPLIALALPPLLLLYSLLTALAGGWDAQALTEAGKAVQLSGLGWPFAWVWLQAIRLGTSLSPLRGRVTFGLYALAAEEARALSAAQRSPSQTPPTKA